MALRLRKRARDTLKLCLRNWKCFPRARVPNNKFHQSVDSENSIYSSLFSVHVRLIKYCSFWHSPTHTSCLLFVLEFHISNEPLCLRSCTFTVYTLPPSSRVLFTASYSTALFVGVFRCKILTKATSVNWRRNERGWPRKLEMPATMRDCQRFREKISNFSPYLTVIYISRSVSAPLKSLR